MSWQRWDFRFMDTCFFRDAVPFNAGEGGYSSVTSHFPPFMTALRGAVRTSLALEKGWNPDDKASTWPRELGGPDDPGCLSFRGPYLLSKGEPYFPVPLLLLRKNREGFMRLAPGDPVECDLGRVRLPRPAGEEAGGVKLVEGAYLNREGMEKVLDGGVPSEKDVKYRNCFCSEEPRVGIERRDESRRAEEGRLYNSVHIRPKKQTSVAVYIGGIPSDWKTAERRIVPLGGEARLAAVEVLKGSPGDVLPSMPSIKPGKDGIVRFTVILITPGWYGDGDAGKIKDVIEKGPSGVPGKCVSACIGRTVYIGGWDMINCEPRPLVPALPPGSLWFFEAESGDAARLKELHGRCISSRENYGFGQIIIGRWEDIR